MTADAERLVRELDEVGESVREKFGSMSPEQLNWKPASDSWSIAQCLDHLILSNEKFFGDLDGVAAGTRQNSFWEKWSPLSGIGGRFIVSSLKKDSMKSKTGKSAAPPSDLGGDIVEKFIGHQRELAAKVRSTGKADWAKVKLTSPFLPLLTYSLENGVNIVVEHEKRHVRQAERVAGTEGFPARR